MERIAYINDQPFAIKDGETILTFVRRNFGRILFLPYVMRPIWIRMELAESAVWMLRW